MHETWVSKTQKKIFFFWCFCFLEWPKNTKQNKKSLSGSVFGSCLYLGISTMLVPFLQEKLSCNMGNHMKYLFVIIQIVNALFNLMFLPLAIQGICVSFSFFCFHLLFLKRIHFFRYFFFCLVFLFLFLGAQFVFFVRHLEKELGTVSQYELL